MVENKILFKNTGLYKGIRDMAQRFNLKINKFYISFEKIKYATLTSAFLQLTSKLHITFRVNNIAFGQVYRL